MFTGIIAAVGRVMHIRPLADGIKLTIAAEALDLSDVAIGDSIACNGVCLTVVERSASEFVVDVSRETLNCTAGLDGANRLNLEKALRLADRLGGHLVSGHVDGVGEVVSLTRIGESHEFVIRAPSALAKYIARKGSIVVNGVSLTTNRVDGDVFSINLIPHTMEATTLQDAREGSLVNLEVDLIARYVERMMAAS